MIVVFTIFTGITVYLVYYNWSLIKNNISSIKFNTHKKQKFRDRIYKMGIIKQISKIELIIFTMILLILKILMQNC